MGAELHDQETIRSLIRDTTARLKHAGIETAALDAELLAAAAAGVDRAALLAGSVPVSGEVMERLRGLVMRRTRREPLAYITGRREFFSLEFEVAPAVLIPRPETELLVEAAIEAVAHAPRCRIIEVGAGCGAVAIALAINVPIAEIVATDISAAALAIARRNALRHGVARRISFVEADLWPSGECGPPSAFDLIVSNPPYIAEPEFYTLSPELRFEPRIALAAGAAGLDFYKRIVAGIATRLKPGGLLLLEVGAGQSGNVARLCARRGAIETCILRDLAGNDRVVRSRFEFVGGGAAKYQARGTAR